MDIKTTPFGTMPDGTKVFCYTLTNNNDLSINIINYGGIIKNIFIKDKFQNTLDICLGQDTLKDYIERPNVSGAIIGRVANRTKNASFALNGKTYQLEKNNNGIHNLHSGSANYKGRVFEGNTFNSKNEVGVVLSLFDNGEGGFASSLKFSITYSLSNDNVLKLTYKTEPSEDTPVNVTNHCYFNLSGHNSGKIYDQIVKIDADRYTALDDSLIPNGEFINVKDTAFDFTSPKKIGQDILNGKTSGYDHNFVITGNGFRKFASAYDEKSGLAMDVYSDLPGVQFYTGNFIPNNLKGKDGTFYNKHDGFCFESQQFPNAINIPNFPSPIQKGGKKYKTVTEFHFSVK